MKILLDNIPIELSNSELIYMSDNKIIKLGRFAQYKIVKDSEFKFLFDKSLPKYKKKLYLESMVSQNFKCSCCGASHSYHIGPFIDEDGSVDFNQVLCLCKKCRLEKLLKRKIIKPVYEQHINWKRELNYIHNDIRKYKISNKKEYIDLCCQIIILSRFVNLVLPIKKIDSIKIENRIVDLSKKEVRINVKKHLYNETNGFCPVCDTKMSYDNFTIDHIIAKKLGGENNLNNFIGMCSKCNLEKGHKSVMLFLLNKKLNTMPLKLLRVAYEQQKNAKIKLQELLEEKKKYQA